MLKIRMQGTLKDIRWFKGLMERHGEIKVKDVSNPFKNKGTDQYVRVYRKRKKRISKAGDSDLIRRRAVFDFFTVL